MTISFSGLASGLDTTSWVESLVALKQAKVETLEEEKETVLLSQETLNNIKSFFSSFRSMIEKITDAKFGIPTMDLFAQNLATSSNLEILTASATTEAEEATYDVLVDKLATETKAQSHYSFMTTLVQTTTATSDSKLTSLGVKAGEIGIKVNGVESIIDITENDTIGTFIEKLNNIGVEANFNEQTGVFSINISEGDINDIGGTGIVDALHLDGVNEGYISNTLQISQTDTIFSAATDATLLSEFGVNAGVITIHANDTDYNITITDSTTFGSFISDLNRNNIDAELSSDGYFSISDANITNEGTTNILDALGLSSETFNKNQTTDDLTHTTIITEVTAVDGSTLLKDIGEGVAIADGSTVIVRNSNNVESTITVNSTTTLGDLLTDIADAGLYTNMDSNGSIEISGGTITGGSLDITDILGLTENVGGRYTNSDELYVKHTVTVDVTLDTELSNYGIDSDTQSISERTLELYDNSGNLIASTILESNTTIESLLDFINQFGTVNATLENGTLTVRNGYISNDLLESSMGLETNSLSSYALGSIINVTTSVEVTGESKLGEIIASLGMENIVSGGYDLEFDGASLGVSEDTSINELISLITAKGGSASLTSAGRLEVHGGSLTGSVATALGITSMVRTIAVSSTGDTLYTKTEVVADESTTFDELRIGDSSYIVNDNLGNPLKTVTVDGTTTLGEFFSNLSADGINGEIVNGKITLSSPSYKYISGMIPNALGMQPASVTTTSNATQSSSAPVYYTDTLTADLTSELGEIGAITGSSDNILIYNSDQVCIATISNLTTSSTINDMFTALQAYGINGSINNGIITLRSDSDYYAAGTIMDNLGISVLPGTNETITVGMSVSSSIAVTYTEVTSITENTLISEAAGDNKFMAAVNRLTEQQAIQQGYTVVHNAQEFVNAMTDLDAKVILMDDIDLSELSSYTPIGNMSNPFTGSFNGNGYTISNLNLTVTDANSPIGLFGAIENADIRNVRIENATLQDAMVLAAGILSGYAWSSTIDNVSVDGTINGYGGYGAGLLVGMAGETTINNSYATGSITTNTTSGVVGGLVGTMTECNLNNTWAGVNITDITSSGSNIGGLVGYIDSSLILDSYAYGSINSNSSSNVGAVLGYHSSLITRNVYYDSSMGYAPGCDATAMSGLSSGLPTMVVTSDGRTLATLNLGSDATIGDFLTALSSYGITGSVSNGIITLNSSNGNHVIGSIPASLGIGTSITGGGNSNTVGYSSTSESVITYTEAIVATEDTLMWDVFSATPPSGNITIGIRQGSGYSDVGTITITSTTTVGDFFDDLAAWNITGSISNGVMHFESSNGYYMYGSYLSQLGIDANITTTTIAESQMIFSDYITYTTTTYATESTTWGELGLEHTDRIVVLNNQAQQQAEIYLYTDMTLGAFLTTLEGYGFTYTFNNGYITLNASNGNVIASETNTLLEDILGISTTYTNTTRTVAVTNPTSSEVATFVVDPLIQETTKLGNIRNFNIPDSGYTILVSGRTYTLTADNTFNDLFQILDQYGIDGYISNGSLVINGTGYGDTSSGGFFFTISGKQWYVENRTLTVEQTTTLGELAYFGSSRPIIQIKDVNTGEVTSYSFSEESTIADVLSPFSGSISNGIITLYPPTGTYISYITYVLADVLNIEVGEGKTYNLSVTTTPHNSSSKQLLVGEEHLLTGNNTTNITLEDLGVTSDVSIVLGQCTNPNITRTLNFSKTATLYDLEYELSRFDLSLDYNADGTIDIAGYDNTFLKSMSSNLVDALKLEGVGLGYSYTTSTETEGSNSNSDLLYESYNTSQTINENTTLADLGLNNSTAYTTQIYQNGTTYTIDLFSDYTLGEYIDLLSGYGITASLSGGRLTISCSGNAYVTSMNSDLSNALDINVGLGYTYTITSGVTIGNSSSDSFSETVVQNMTSATNFGKLGLSGNSYITVVSNGTERIITVDSSKTLGDIISSLSANGIYADISNGRLTLNGSSSSYILGMSSNLEDILNLETGNNNSYIVEVNNSWYNSDSNQQYVVKNDLAIKEDTLLSSINGFNLGNGYIDITNKEGNVVQSIQIQSDWTVRDFLNQISIYGLNGLIDSSGKVTISSTNGNHLTASSGGANILDVFNINDTSFGTSTIHYNQTSPSLNHTVTAFANGTSTLGELLNNADNGISFDSSGNASLVINTQSEQGSRNVTINFTKTQSLQDVINRLAEYGITASVSNGVFSVYGANMTDFEISGTIGDFLKADDAKIYSEETYCISNSLSGQSNVNMNDDTRLDELGITGGNIVINQDALGNAVSVVNIDTSTIQTIGDFRNLLSIYGFTTNIDSSGRLSVSSSGSGSLQNATGGSNILDVLGLTNWTQSGLTQSSKTLTYDEIEIDRVTMSDKIGDLTDASGNSLGITSGQIYVYKDGNKTKVNINTDDTLSSLAEKLKQFGITIAASQDGKLYFDSQGDTYLTTNGLDPALASNILDAINVPEDWSTLHSYEGEALSVIQKTTLQASATRDTLLSELGVTTGEYFIYSNGVKYTALISSDETLGSFMDTLKSFGLETILVEGPDGSVLSVIGNGNSYVAKSTSTTNASNVVEKLFTNGVDESKEYSGTMQTSQTVTTYSQATEDTLLSEFDTPWGGSTLTAEGNLSVTVNGKTSIIEIRANETIGSLLDKFRRLGIEATLSNGQIMLQSGYDTFTINTNGTTSSLLITTGLVYQDDLGGYSASTATVESTTTTIEERTLSVSNYADLSTELGTLNISGGSLTIYRNGERATIDIQSSDTFSDLRAKVASVFSDVDLRFEDGYLSFYSTAGNTIDIGATTDTSNFSAITGISKDENGNVRSSRELYRVNSDSRITDSGLFRNGTVTEGTFVLGNATFTITNTTTLSDIISQINASDDANATAYWDNIDGKFVIKSRTTGAAYINIEAGTSNFTDIMGFTKSETNPDDGTVINRMNMDAQSIGENARVTINGTAYTSTSNTITSDISRIKGLTINLKGLTEGTAVTITVERDKESLANAISDVVDSYNELMLNIDEAIATDGSLHGETTLKLIRNQLRNMMTSSDAGTTIFRNLDAIGISVSDASASNISTSNESIINLSFDKDKFLDAFEADQNAVKELLIGGVNNTGVFTKVETLLESALEGVSGYFASAENSYQREVNRLDERITKANTDIERYRARLEAKFASMDLLIAQMQQQYSTFLIT